MSDECFTFHEGELPLLISVPHDGRRVPPELLETMTPAARALPDTDWHVARLYAFCRDLGASLLIAGYSRYVVDLNRPASDAALYAGQVKTGLCPSRTFAGEPIYRQDRKVPAAEQKRRIGRYWQPYHDRLGEGLETLESRHGYALLWDAHSIASRVPRLFDGELPALNLGTNDGQSCPPAVAAAVAARAAASPYPSVLNGRFRGGFITRHYGVPHADRYAIQLELAQRCYMSEATLRYARTRAARLRETLRRLLLAYLDAAGNELGRDSG